MREPYDTVLIVCEGAKTEPFYFRGLRSSYRLSNANILITPAEGTDPVSIVKFAEQRVSQYDRTYCVFDRDTHPNYGAAIQRAANSKPGIGGKLMAITSVPCFELWLLLHYRYSTAPIVASKGKSPGGIAEKELTRHIPKYKKGDENIFEIVNPLYQTALGNAKALHKHSVETASDNPHTRVYELVEYLRQLKP